MARACPADQTAGCADLTEDIVRAGLVEGVEDLAPGTEVEAVDEARRAVAEEHSGSDLVGGHAASQRLVGRESSRRPGSGMSAGSRPVLMPFRRSTPPTDHQAAA